MLRDKGKKNIEKIKADFSPERFTEENFIFLNNVAKIRIYFKKYCH